MKNLLCLFLITLTFLGIAQEKYGFQTDPETGEQIIVGVYSRDIMYLPDWEDAYFNYEVDEIAADELIPLTENIKILIVGAQWCSDSRNVIPALYKVLDYLSFTEEDVEVVMVNRDKKGLSDEVDVLGIDFVPTIIFYKNGEEIGRIIEQPFESIERDMLSILYEPVE
ncbi:MAG TPA: thioredoxin family protein [Ignavibacteriaceae bacterium]|nr:thioredoxin family protein [Ignavibacteriaceae bacterium]